MKAVLSNFRQSPRKVRLVVDLIRGKSVQAAREALTFLPKKSMPEIAKLLSSAVANAHQQGATAEDLFVKTIFVNKAGALRRFMPKARGRAARFERLLSTISLELGKIVTKEKKAPKAKKVTKAKAAKE